MARWIFLWASIGVLVLAILLVIPRTGGWLRGFLGLASHPQTEREFRPPIRPPEKIKLPEKVTIADTVKKQPCNCDTVAIRKGWVKIVPREHKKHLAPRHKKQELTPPFPPPQSPPPPQKVEVDVKVSGDVKVTGSVGVQGTQFFPPPPPPAPNPGKGEEVKAPCDTCKALPKWKSHFWGKEFNEKKGGRN